MPFSGEVPVHHIAGGAGRDMVPRKSFEASWARALNALPVHRLPCLPDDRKGRAAEYLHGQAPGTLAKPHDHAFSIVTTLLPAIVLAIAHRPERRGWEKIMRGVALSGAAGKQAGWPFVCCKGGAAELCPARELLTSRMAIGTA